MAKAQARIVYPPLPAIGNMRDLQTLMWHELVDLRAGRATVTHAASVAALCRQFVQFMELDSNPSVPLIEHNPDEEDV